MYYEGWFCPSSLVTLAAVLLLLCLQLLLFNALLKKKTSTSTSTSAAVKTQKTHNSSSTSPPGIGWDYEVFLSFRGKDTRTSFTDYLFQDLVEAGIRTFRDDDELRVGEKIGPELLKAIQHSKISIPIFSADYASSKWCLLELTQMVECMRSTGQMIFPIFYDVEPSDVRHQTGRYKEAFKRFPDDETVKGWKEALREVAQLKGWEVKKTADGHQGKLIKEVVSKVLRELKKKYLVVTDCLVGIDSHVEELIRLLSTADSNDVRIVGIHGMGGIGKTTIARVVYNKLVENFESCSFLADVRETSQQHNGLVDLQNKLLSDILKRKGVNIVTAIDEGINMIKDRFCNKKVLIVLDDVDQKVHFDAFAGKRDWFGSGSRIIVTTRNKDVLNVPQVDWTCETKEMDSNQSLQLFSKHAFRKDHPPEDYDILSRDVVSTASGLPLALEIMGSFLSGKREAVWKDTVEKLKRIPDNQVQKKLRISYEELDDMQKEIFLDIACLFIGVDKRIAFHMWNDCKFNPENGIEVLLLMSLVKIGDNNELRMHDQLRGLGREIVRKENKEPGKRSRLWHHQEALDILESHAGTGKVEALCLDFGFESRGYDFTNEEFAKLSNLRFLQINYVNIAGDFERLFLKLSWLRWNGCPQNFEPTNFHPKNLVILDLSWSKVTESWEGWSQIEMAKRLKVLNLTACGYLIRTPDFSSYTSLERLILEDCESLVQIDPSIGHLKSLVFLNAKNCAKLKELPLEFGSLKTLVELFIDGTSIQEVPISRGRMKKLETFSATCCGSLTQVPSSIGLLESLSDLAFDFSRITELPDSIGSLAKLRQLSLRYCLSLRKIPESIGKLESLTELHLFAARIRELPDAIGNLKNLRVLDICFSFITKLPNSIGMLAKLEEIHAFNCYNLEGEIPSNIGRLSSLRILILGCTNVCGLPTSICGLSHLQTLDLVGCRELRLLPELPSSLMSLRVTCVLMETFPNLSNLMNLKELCFSNCLKLVEIPGDSGKLSKLESLTLYNIKIDILPLEIGALSRLKELVIQSCEQLQCLPALPSGLFKLCLQVCESMERLPDLSDLKNLSELMLGRCLKLTEIQGLGELELLTSLDVSECKKLPNLDGLQQLVFLRYLTTSRCKSLETLPDLSNLKKLRKLVTLRCKKLSEIPGVDRLKSLEHLNMSRCISMERLPDLSNLEMLKQLHLVQCEKLREIEGIEFLESLKTLDLSLCTSLERLPNLSNLKNLKKLQLHNCEKLIEIQGLEELKSLAFLDISGCKLVERLPDLSNINKVER